jgi:hypothetical protein
MLNCKSSQGNSLVTYPGEQGNPLVTYPGEQGNLSVMSG